jgi:glucose-6-phosphate isomerase
VRAGPGDRVIIPPGFGHVTINPGGTTLAMANIVSTRFESDYTVYERFRGAAYYELEGGTLVKNPSYPMAARVRILHARDQKGLDSLPDRPLYDLIGTESLGFLNHPEDHPGLFS